MSRVTKPAKARPEPKKRTLPHSVEGEKGVLSSIMRAPADAIPKCVAAGLNRSWFYVPAHQTFYVELCDVWDSGGAIDLITFTARLRGKELLDEVGGPIAVTELQTYLTEIRDYNPIAENLPDYIDIVRGMYVRRQIIRSAAKDTERAYDALPDADMGAMLDETISRALSLRSLHGRNSTPEPDVPKLRPLSDVDMLPIRFVDKPLFQADAFHLVVGKKNAGKGTFLSHVAARVTLGEFGKKKNVIWIAAGEDSLALDVRPRIEAAGGDVDKVYYPPFVPRLPAETGLLQKWAEELGGVGFIVLDPLSGMLPDKCDSHRDSDVRPVITPLNDLADHLECLVVGVRHLKKDASGGALDSVLGSVDWVNVPRAVIAIVYDKNDDVRYAQVVAGNRVPGDSESRGFRIVGANVVPGGEPVAKAVFIDGPGKDVDFLLIEDRPKDNPTKTRQAAIRILDILEAYDGDGFGLKQEDVFNTVAQELSMSPQTVRQKAYFGNGMLHDLGLVKSYKETGKLTGGWFFKRSDLPRPPEFYGKPQ